MLFWREAHLEVKMYKAHNVRSTFRNWDVEKNARCCGAKHIWKSKCTKHTMFGALLEIEMSKKCTPLRREAHFEVKSVKNWRSRATFGRSDVVSHGRRKGLCTLPKVSKKWVFCRSFNYNRHYTTLHSTTLHYNYNYNHNRNHITLHYTNCITLHYTITTTTTTLHYITLIPLHYTTLITLHYTTLHFTSLYYTKLDYATLHYTQLHFTTTRTTTTTTTTTTTIALHYTTLTTATTTTTTTLHYTHYTNYITLRYATLHYTTLHHTTPRYTTPHQLQLQLQLP